MLQHEPPRRGARAEHLLPGDLDGKRLSWRSPGHSERPGKLSCTTEVQVSPPAFSSEVKLEAGGRLSKMKPCRCLGEPSKEREAGSGLSRVHMEGRRIQTGLSIKGTVSPQNPRRASATMPQLGPAGVQLRKQLQWGLRPPRGSPSFSGPSSLSPFILSHERQAFFHTRVFFHT